MRGPSCIPFVLVLPLTMAACSTSPLTLPPPAQPVAKDESTQKSEVPAETAIIASGSPTDVYALVARGANRCWFGADGPLKPTHVFHAEALSPAQGGAAEMVLHERDESLRDKRGARAFQVSFTAVPAGARVAVTSLKMDPQLGGLMTKDVVTWARGGSECQLGRHTQPITPVVGNGDVGAVRRR